MSATFLYTLLLGLIYLVKVNVKALQAKRRQDYFAKGKKRLTRAVQREAQPQVALGFREKEAALREVVVELT
ncbi:MAG: hypothetical protein HRU41_11235 [Saprospiraceae bacterium]|nr:hypothetical protein [Saprospiraceae bacterium]